MTTKRGRETETEAEAEAERVGKVRELDNCFKMI